jgi:plastocyanin
MQLIAKSRALGLAAALVVVAACGSSGASGGGAQGYASPPASLDASSPALAAKGIKFDKSELDVPAGAAFTLVFDNQEGVGHNVSIYQTATYGGTRMFEGVVFSGPSTRWYPVPALAAGTYEFRCDVHPNMTGKLVAA